MAFQLCFIVTDASESFSEKPCVNSLCVNRVFALNYELVVAFRMVRILTVMY